MRFSNPSTVASLFLLCNVAQGSLLEKRFSINGPEYKYEDLQFSMDFEISDFVQDSMIEYSLYDGMACKDGGDNDITENSGYLLSRIRTDQTPPGDGNGVRKIKIQSELNSKLIKASPIYQEDEDGNVTVEYCMRFGVYNTDKTNAFAMETNFLEIPVKLVIDLNAGFEVDAAVSNADGVLVESEQGVAVEAYICDDDENIVPIVGFEQGQTVRVCVSPTPSNLAAGALMRQIESFTFRRLSPLLVEQPAISPQTGGDAADDLTIVWCQPGSTVCAFETLLYADFFVEEGQVLGAGTAFLQLGTGASATSRRLQETPNQILSENPTKFGVTLNLVTVESSYQMANTSGAAPAALTTAFFGLASLATALVLF